MVESDLRTLVPDASRYLHDPHVVLATDPARELWPVPRDEFAQLVIAIAGSEPSGQLDERMEVASRRELTKFLRILALR